jgi:type II secretory pathway component PulM
MGLELEARAMKPREHASASSRTDQTPSHVSSLWQTLWHAKDSFSPRERQGFHLALAILTAAFFWRFGWLPLQAYFSPPSATQQSLAEDIESLERQQLEVKAIRALPMVSLAQGQKSFEQITQNVMPQAQLRFNDHRVNVSLGAVSPQDLSKWLLSLKEQVACKVVQSDLARTQMPGNAPPNATNSSNPSKSNPNAVLWTGRLVFEFAHAP